MDLLVEVVAVVVVVVDGGGGGTLLEVIIGSRWNIIGNNMKSMEHMRGKKKQTTSLFTKQVLIQICPTMTKVNRSKYCRS